MESWRKEEEERKKVAQQKGRKGMVGRWRKVEDDRWKVAHKEGEGLGWWRRTKAGLVLR